MTARREREPAPPAGREADHGLLSTDEEKLRGEGDERRRGNLLVQSNIKGKKKKKKEKVRWSIVHDDG